MFKGYIIGNNLSVNDVQTGKCPNDLSFESEWGNRPITQNFIHSIKEFGFNTVKLPITWTCHAIFTKNSCIIQDWFIDRVREIVQWCIDDKLYVIVNTQHDEDWIAHNSNEKEITNKVKLLWSAILDALDDLSTEYLIFEDLNEVGYEVYEGGLERFLRMSEELYHLIRSKNSARKIISNGMWSDILAIADNYDHLHASDDNLYLGLHFYTPIEYTIPEEVQGIYKSKKWILSELVSTFENLDTIRNRFGNTKIICSEFGCSMSKKDIKQVEFWYRKVLNYFNANHIGFMLWDSGHDFDSIFDRSDDKLKIKIPEIKDYLVLKNI